MTSFFPTVNIGPPGRRGKQHVNHPSTPDGNHAPHHHLWPVGGVLGTSAWLVIDQDRIDRFGAVTDDLEPLHNDAAWCSLHSPYGKPIAYGFLTLSLLTAFMHQVTRDALKGAPGRTGFPLNYGFDRVRFITPVAVGSRIRCQLRLLDRQERPDGQLMRIEAVVEVEHQPRPALVADWLSLWVEQQPATVPA